MSNTGGWPFSTQVWGPFYGKNMGPNSVEVQTSEQDGAQVIAFLKWYSPNFGQQLLVSYDNGDLLSVYKVGPNYEIKGFVTKTVYSKNELDVCLSTLSNDQRGDILFTVLDNRFNAVNYFLRGPENAGNWPITSGQVTGQVTGLNLTLVPTSVVLTVQAPSFESDGLYAWIVGAPTTDGFYYQVSGIPPFEGYKLNFSFEFTPISAASSATPFTEAYSGQANRNYGYSGGDRQSLTAGETTGTISYLLWPRPPTSVVLTVQSPDGDGLGLYAWVINSPGRDSFQYVLSGVPDRDGYVLHYAASFVDNGNQLTLPSGVQVCKLPLNHRRWRNVRPTAIITTPQLPANGEGLFSWVSTPYSAPGYFVNVDALPE